MPIRPSKIFSFLAHGSSKIKTSVDFALGEATISRILDQVTQAIIHCLAPIYMAYPSKEEFVDIEKGFWRRWNVPNVSSDFQIPTFSKVFDL